MESFILKRILLLPLLGSRREHTPLSRENKLQMLLHNREENENSWEFRLLAGSKENSATWTLLK
jgi:hypothetical protein